MLTDLDREGRSAMATSPAVRTLWPVVALVAALIALPVVAGAQTRSGRVPRVAVVLLSPADPNIEAFRQGLRDLGHVEGQSLLVEYRHADGDPARLADVAAEVVRLKPDVIFALGGDVAPLVRQATRTIPTVIVTSNDPVRAGLVASLARPGGNVTGLTFLASDLAAKRLQLLKEVMPAVSRVGVLRNPLHADDELQETQEAARGLGIHVQSLDARGVGEFDGAFQGAVRERVEAIVVVSSRQMTLNRPRILQFGRDSRLPLVCGWGPWAQEGALLSYGPDLGAIVRRAAGYVDRIVKGARPEDLPVEQPTKFELIVNLATAKGLGLTIPASVLARADRVIE
jgi:ABC-type uncharacterized transport system substrate-binding protein